MATIVLAGSSSLHPAAELVDEPGLRGDGSRLALLEVLVVGHEDLIVGRCGVAAIGPVGIVERRRDSDEPTVRRERRAQLAQEGQKVPMRVLRDFLEIDRQVPARRWPAGRQRDCRCAPCAWRDRPVGARARGRPIAVGGVLQHRQHAGALLLLAQEVDGFLVDAGLQFQVRAGKLEPARHHPVELRKRRLQRREAAVIPGHVEADRQAAGCRYGRARPGSALADAFGIVCSTGHFGSALSSSAPHRPGAAPPAAAHAAARCR